MARANGSVGGSALKALVPFAILFLGGFNYALPAYRWATPVQVFHGVFVNDILVILYVAALPLVARSVVVAPAARTLGFAILIATLGLCGVMSAGVNRYSLLDFGEAGKLFMFTAYFLLAVRWCRTHGETFVLRAYLTGVAVGGAINIYYSIAEPYDALLGIPVLRSQNGAGGLLGLSVGLGGWLLVGRRTAADTRVALAVTVVGLCAAAISYSKTSMTMAACGIVVWLFVLASALAARHSRRLALALVIASVGAATCTMRTDGARETIAAVRRLAANKFANIDLSNKYSVGVRYMYFWGVLEIVNEHPLTGVSYSGFYDAITQTAAYRSGQMADELTEPWRQGEANPHNSFLYYAAANGIPGLVVVLCLYIIFVQELFRSQARRRLAGAGISSGLALAYFIYANTLPTLFNTDVLYVPAAVAMAQVTMQRARQARTRSRVVDPPPAARPPVPASLP